MLADEDLLQRWRSGDREAGTSFLDRHQASLRRFFANRGCDTQDVDELLQRTLTAATESAHRYQGKASPRTWLFAIAHNILRRWMAERARRRTRHIAGPQTSVADLGAGMSTVLMARHEQRLLLEALRQLPLESQLVLQLRYWDNVKTSEIAEILSCEEPAGRYRLKKARDELVSVLHSFARETPKLETTVTSLEDWAKTLRDDWGA